MNDESRFDAFLPAEIAVRVREVGVAKARLSAANVLALAVLAGAFIALGAMFSTVAISGVDEGFGVRRLLAGTTFSLGLVLVVVAGAELFTGNNLIAMAWASRQITAREVLRNWSLVYLGNLIGSLGTALLFQWSGAWKMGGGVVGATALRIAAAKCELPFIEAFFRGVLCNALVCLAIWLCFSARTTTDKIISIVLPITAFVALGFEHSVANMYFIPLGILLQRSAGGADLLSAVPDEAFGWLDFATNLVPVTLGNIVGGTLLVAGIYWFVYLRGDRKA
jgi:formate/nitrite transporter